MPTLPGLPRPFSEFPKESQRCEAAIYWFALVGTRMKEGCKSLCEVYEKLPEMSGLHASYTFIRQLPSHLTPLLRKCLERDGNEPIELYWKPFANSSKIVGLTADGQLALRLALDYVKAEYPELDFA